MISLRVLKWMRGTSETLPREIVKDDREERDSQWLYYRMCIPLSRYIVKNYIKNTIYCGLVI